jgi:hypothetical protein
MKKQFFLMIIAAIFAFVGCKKATEIDEAPLMSSLPPGGTTVGTSIRSFPNNDALNVEVAKTLAFTYDELVAYEQSNSFNSFGKLAESAMMPVIADIEEISEKEENAPNYRASEVLNLLNANSQFLHVITEDEEDYCETKYHRSPYRYIMNSQCVFKVDTFYYKVFEGGHAYCGVSNYNRLFNMSEADFSALEDNDIFTVYKYSDNSRGNYGHSVKRTNASGKEQVIVELYYVQIDRRMVSGCVKINGSFVVKTKGYRKALGIWWQVKRTCTNNISGTINVYNSTQSGSDNGTTFGYKREKVLSNISLTLPQGVNNENIYINSSSGYGKIPAVTCNMNLN